MLSSTPVIEQVAVPMQVCAHESVVVPHRSHGAGAAIGAIAGGAIGNAIGHGGARAASTVIGILGGAVIGDHIEGEGSGQVQWMQRCTTQMRFENRVTRYNVVYDYAGRQYAAQMPQDPGPTLRVQVTPVEPAPVPLAAPVAGYAQVQTVVAQVPYAAPVFIAIAPAPAPRWR